MSLHIRPAQAAELQRADGTVERLPSKVASKSIAKGDVFRLVTAGGGGYGDPAKRSQEAVRDDITNGYLSRETAAAQYGPKPG